MGNRFDSYAKRNARAAASPAGAGTGLTRRQALVGGALVTGAAWTAPALLASTPAWAAASCPGGAVRCGTAQACCPAPVNGNPYTCPTATNVCTAPGEIGGACTNNGAGTSGCRQSSSSSIHCNNAPVNICGGVGAQCDVNDDCAKSAPYCKGSGQQKFCSTSS